LTGRRDGQILSGKMKTKTKTTMLDFTCWLLRTIPSTENDLIEDIIKNVRLIVEEQGHNALSGLQLGCIFGKYFEENPKDKLGKKLKKAFLDCQFIDDKKFVGYE
jgi:hypothetical protein